MRGVLMQTRKEKIQKVYKVRSKKLTIYCTDEEKKTIVEIAESKEISVSDLVHELVEEKYHACPIEHSHIPNAETIASIEASERGEGIEKFESMDDLFKDLGINECVKLKDRNNSKKTPRRRKNKPILKET